MKSSNDIKYELKIHVAFEIIDISIEMKNQLKLGRVVQDLNCANDRVLKFIPVYYSDSNEVGICIIGSVGRKYPLCDMFLKINFLCY